MVLKTKSLQTTLLRGVQVKCPEYVEACSDVIRASKKVIYPRHNLNIAAKPGDTSAPNMEKVASAKLYDVSSDALINAFLSGRTQCFSLPYLLDDHQQQAVEAIGSVVIIGRGGTGKTAVLANRLFGSYQRAVESDSSPPRQLFVSQSRGLVQTVQVCINALGTTATAAPYKLCVQYGL